MSKKSDFSPVRSSIVIRELITELKISDVMNRDLTVAGPKQSLRSVQKKMKENGISGVPVVENRQLVGIISLDDIINAIENNKIDAPVEESMSRNLILLKESMPLSIAIAHFEKYTYRRFPVVNSNSELVGIVTGRDILSKLLFEINREVSRLENLIPISASLMGTHLFCKKYFVKKYDMEKAGFVSGEIKKMCKKWNIDRRVIRKIAVTIYELEINLIVHSDGGTLTCIFDSDKFKLISQDSGPGINNINLVMQEGYSTANEWVKSLGFGAGMGLPNTKKISDDFSIESEYGKGTTITSTINLQIEVK